MSTASTPFCSVITTVSGPMSGVSRGAELSTSYSLTVNSTTSTGPISAGSSVAVTGRCAGRPSGLVIRRPSLPQRGEVRAARDER